MVSLLVRLGLTEPTIEDRGARQDGPPRLAEAEALSSDGPHPQPGRARRVQALHLTRDSARAG